MKRYDIACFFALAAPNLVYFAMVAAAPSFKAAAEPFWYGAQALFCVVMLLAFLSGGGRIRSPAGVAVGGALVLSLAMHTYFVSLVGFEGLLARGQSAFLTSQTLVLAMQTLAFCLLPVVLGVNRRIA